MDTAATAALLYERIGRYLTPIPRDKHVVNDGKRIPVKPGICQRTGVEGMVVDWVERIVGDRRVVPTLAHLLWIYGRHDVLNKKGQYGNSRLGPGSVIAVTEDHIYTNVTFAKRIPHLRTVATQNAVLREIATTSCVFLAFSASPTTLLGNGLRWSVGDELEVNGRFSLAKNVTVENTAISLGRALRITHAMTKQAATDIRWLLFRERDDEQQERLEQTVAQHQMRMDALQLLYAASEQEMILAHRLWNE